MNSENNFLKSIAVLIPSLDPDKRMPEYVNGLCEAGFRKIIVIDDGSQQSTQKYFNIVKQQEGVVLLRHAVNQGKGRALKTGFNYFLNTCQGKEMKGIVTADADGQHSVEDTVRVALKLYQTDNLILGTRDFNDASVPFKSKMGNKITTGIFYALYGRKLKDTQTGLRGIPLKYIASCLAVDGERFEYEIAVLIEAVRRKMPVIEESIETIYLDGNRATHFHAVKDSADIYKVIFQMFFKFTMSGITSFVIDISLFSLFAKIIPEPLDILYATISARIISSFFNFMMNRNIFTKKHRSKKMLFKYYALCTVQLACSCILVNAVFGWVKWNATLIKCFIDLILFFISYQIQRIWVFKEEVLRWH